MLLSLYKKKKACFFHLHEKPKSPQPVNKHGIIWMQALHLGLGLPCPSHKGENDSPQGQGRPSCDQTNMNFVVHIWIWESGTPDPLKISTHENFVRLVSGPHVEKSKLHKMNGSSSMTSHKNSTRI